jgi:hypothetical protein
MRRLQPIRRWVGALLIALALIGCTLTQRSQYMPSTLRPTTTLTISTQPSPTTTKSSTNTPIPQVGTTFTQEGRVLYMESNQVRIAIDLNWGGAIREIWFNGQNLVNNYDGGRLVGVSFYDSDLPPVGNFPDTGWNPTPSDMYNHVNQPLEVSTANNEAYIRSRYLQWFPNDKGGGPNQPIVTDIIVETWIAFFGDARAIRLTYRITNESQDSHGVAGQEFPFAYIRTPFNRFVTYAGNRPWTHDPALVSEIPVVTITSAFTGAENWTSASENWAGLINSNDIGIILWAPQAYGVFTYSTISNPGPTENSTNYLAPRAFLQIGPRFSVETQAFLFLGPWQEGRERIYDLATSLEFADIMPCFGYVDAPIEGAAASGTLLIDGWAIDDHRVAQVSIRVDGQTIGQAAYGQPRPDVARDYPGLPGTPAFGFNYQLHTTSFANGLHTIEVIAEDPAGNLCQLRPGPISIEISN